MLTKIVFNSCIIISQISLSYTVFYYIHILYLSFFQQLNSSEQQKHNVLNNRSSVHWVFTITKQQDNQFSEAISLLWSNQKKVWQTFKLCMLHLTMRSEFLGQTPHSLWVLTPAFFFFFLFFYLACLDKYLSTCMLHWFHPAPADGPHPSPSTHSGTWDAGEILPWSCHSVTPYMHIL